MLAIAGSASASEMLGKITRIDLKAHTLSVTDQTSAPLTREFAVPSTTRIVIAGQHKTLADLKEGESVKVDFATVGAKHTARRVEVTGRPAKS
jgi:hypothetical protein